MSTGYSGTPLPKKLGLKPGQQALLLNIPTEITQIRDFQEFALIRKRLPSVPSRQFDYIHLFTKDRSVLEKKLPQIHAVLRADGMFWVSWPKKSSGVTSTITEGTLRDVILPTGLVDVKVCAVNEIWSGLKFMFRKGLRGTL